MTTQIQLPRTLLLALLSSSLSFGTGMKPSPEDEKSIRKIVADFNAAENRHDIQALASLRFHPGAGKQ